MSISSGDNCPKCGRGRMRAIASERRGDWQQQRLECKECHHRETAIVSAANIWRRKNTSIVEA